MDKRSALLASLLAATVGFSTFADDYDRDDRPEENDDQYFSHLATFDVMSGNDSGVAEIIDSDRLGKQLAYTDAENNSIGFVNIENAAFPSGQGTVSVGGEPTSLVILRRWVLVAVNTSESYTNPSGKLVVVDRYTQSVVATHELNGQPDSIALSPDRKRAAIVIENERDEDLNGGFIPQNTTGGLLIIDLVNRSPSDWTVRSADLSVVAANAYAGSDLEPEYVDINRQNEAVVTFQENNHLAVIDLITGNVINQFSAGEVDLNSVDNEEEDLINLNSSLRKRREPDAVTWIDNDRFATANEGDYEDELGVEGGSRGFTIFHQNGDVIFESAESFDHWIVSAGHYNEGRSENKGCEPEAVEFANVNGVPTLFVGSERCNVVGVYDISDPWCPVPLQLLPTGIGPEGVKAISNRGLLVVSTEKEVADDGIPTMINIFRAESKKPYYPMIISDDDQQGNPIPWVALSGLVGDPKVNDVLYGVSDSFLAEGFIYKIDVSRKPAVITDRLVINGSSHSLDLEGIAIDEDGYFWVGSEGNDGTRPNLIVKVDPNNGNVIEEIQLPAGLVDQRRKNGIEGIAVTREKLDVGGIDLDVDVIYVAIQRAWPNEGDTDKVNTKIGRYDVVRGWSFVHYPLQPEGNGGWIGLSELTLLPNGKFAVIERDKGWGTSTAPNAELKAIFTVDLADSEFRSYDDPSGLVTIQKTPMIDVLPELEVTSIWTAEKLEGLGVTREGVLYAVTDNDGVDDAPGETLFLELARLKNGKDRDRKADRDRDDDDGREQRRKRD